MCVPVSEELFAKIRDEPKSENGLSLCYQTFGNPAHPAVLLIMGLNAQMVLWHHDFCRAVASKGYFVIRFDNRDCGKSTKLDSVKPPSVCNLVCLPNCCAGKVPYSLEDMAMDAVLLLDALKIRKAHIVGQSMGGMIAQIVAADHPDRVLTLTSIYSSPGNPTPSLKVKLRMAKEPKDGSKEAYVENMLGMSKEVFSIEEHYDEAYFRGIFESSFDRNHERDGGFRQAAAIIRQKPREDRVKAIKCPVLIVHGKQDVVVPYENGEWTKKCIPHAEFVTLNMGHGIVPPLFDPIVGAFHEHCGSKAAEPFPGAAPALEQK